MPLLTIIIPTFNSAATITECIDSIRLQKFSDYEILIQDGKSTDETVSIINAIKREFPQLPVSLFIENDRGIYDAMNKAIKNAKGEWIYFLGSDDSFYDFDVLSNIFEDGSYMSYDVIYGDVDSTLFGGRYDGEFDLNKLFQKNICHQSIFFKKTVFAGIGKFDLKYKVLADWDHNMRWFFAKNIRKKYINLVVANYSPHGYSSNTKDEIFEKYKNIKFLKYAHYKLSAETKKKWFKQELRKFLREGNLSDILALGAYLPYVIFPLYRKKAFDCYRF